MPTVPNSMRFRWPKAPTLSAEPLDPHLKVKLPRDVENKRGWTKGRILKDALADAISAAWKSGRKAFAETFLRIFKEEIEEGIDWNPDEILFELRPPIPVLKWFLVWEVQYKDLKRWVED